MSVQGMSLPETLKDLQAKGLELWLEGDDLRYWAPKDALTPDILAKLKEHEEEIRKLLSESSNGLVSYPLSYNQTSLWVLHQLAPESPAYNVGFVARIRSRVDIPALRRAFQELIARHPTLRTTFAKRGGDLVQTVHRRQPLYFEQINASKWDRQALNAIVYAAHERPFNLELGPVLRVHLYSRADDDHILLLTLHHVVCDGWSLWLLLDELRVLYAAQQQGPAARLPASELTYQDYVRWQKQMLASSKGERLWSYWQSQLAGELPLLNLPTDRSRPPFQTYNGMSHPFKLSAALTGELRRLSQAENTTLFTTLVAAFQVLLYRYSGQEDILLGSVIVGRSRPDFARIVGDFINPVILRGTLTGNPGFKPFLARMRRTVLDALLHQDFPFSLLVERLQVDRDPSRSPLYQVLFNFLKPQQFPEVVELWVGDESGEQVNWGGLALEPFAMPQQEGQMDLTLEMVEGQASLYGVFKYNPDLFDAATIGRMAGHFRTLLEGIVAHPDQCIAELPLLTEQEKRQLIAHWNRTRNDYPANECVHRLFEDQVKRAPDAVAAVFEGRQLSYRELNNRSNQLAHYLQKLGVGPEVRVGICLERSLETIIGLIGILKAGGAYVPLDPNDPAARLQLMLEDTQAPVLITQGNLVEPGAEEHSHLPSVISASRRRVVCLDRDWREIEKESRDNLDGERTADSCAYIIYTSGSTGKPKGVEVPHRGIARLVFGADYADFGADRTFLHLAPTAFDASTFEIWGALLHGGKCVLYPPGVPSAPELGEIIKKHGVTTLWLTASLYNWLIDEAPQALLGVEQLMIGGEALSVPHVRRGLELLPRTDIINGYGPTESTTFACCSRIPRRLEENLVSVPIGKPIGNTRVYILDSRLNPVPIGVAGELYIGGDGLALGYLNDTELTAAKFIRHSFDGEPAERLYRTGDRARYLPDGNIEFLGRIDDQVKIRGYRIEPGEIEAELSRHPGIQTAVVMAREDIPGSKQLAAYVVLHRECPAKSAELRDFLKQRLPDYMIPSAFVFLDALPLTPNGKVDRRALPCPDLDPAEFEETYVAPRNAVEEIIAAIWSEVLGIEQIGIHANFYDLGGHSLNATQVVSRLRVAFHREIRLRHMFEYPTVAELAAVLGM